ncbi:MAG: VCBS repeat-containing protein [Planctomycetota bacterium]
MRKFTSISRLFICGCIVVLISSHASAQFASRLRRRDFSNNFMNFSNVTATNVVETVTEVTDNEKEVEVVDVDKDGDLDVVVIAARSFSFSGRRRNKLYLNHKGVLTESSQLVTGDVTHNGFADYNIGRNGFLRDYDNDGWLDLIVISDIIVGPPVGTTRYYANQHPGGVFTGFVDETERLNGANGDACGGVSADFDQDGDSDFYFGNYPGPSQDTMFFNGGAGTFTQVGSGMVPTDSDYTVDVATGDINGDGKVDIMVCSQSDPNYIYYNDNQGAGEGTGDYGYPNSTQSFGSQNSLYPAMEPGDFNRDGKMDIYFANRGPGNRDVLLINQGNDANNKATFVEMTMPDIVSDTPTAKVTVADLNGDGRKDLIVNGGDTLFQSLPSRRPVIYRNTSVNGQVSFVEWSPRPAFPPGATQSGWHAAAFDVDGDKKRDIFVGGMNHDHLFKHVATPTVKDSTLAGSLPAFHNSDPHAILGSLTTSAGPDNFSGSIPAGATVSAVLSSTADVMLEVRNSGGTVIASSDRGGKGTEEAFEFTAPGGTLEFRVTLLQSTGGPSDIYSLELLSRTE